MTANGLDWACRKCSQQPGEWCRAVDARTGELGAVVPGMLHGERREDASAMTEPTAETPGVDEFLRAAEERLF